MLGVEEGKQGGMCACEAPTSTYTSSLCGFCLNEEDMVEWMVR